MITLKVKQFQSGFFDRKTVLDRVDKATARVLSRAGSFVRTRARSSIRKRRKGISRPGSPPFSRTGKLKQFIFFAYEERARSVVIGPARLNGTVATESLPALEYGGRSFKLERKYGGGANARPQKRRTPIKVAARPFMRPALAAELPKLSAMWRNSVK
jgi:hypothetical protein